MLNWKPLNLCGCSAVITKADTNHEFVRWNTKCDEHRDTDFKTLWALSFEDNLKTLDMTEEEKTDFRNLFNTKYGI